MEIKAAFMIFASSIKFVSWIGVEIFQYQFISMQSAVFFFFSLDE